MARWPQANSSRGRSTLARPFARLPRTGREKTCSSCWAPRLLTAPRARRVCWPHTSGSDWFGGSPLLWLGTLRRFHGEPRHPKGKPHARPWIKGGLRGDVFFELGLDTQECVKYSLLKAFSFH